MAVILGLVVAGSATTSGFDRDRSFYPTVLIVIASYNSLFAVMGASRYSTLEIEIAVGLVFSVFVVLGFKKSTLPVSRSVLAERFRHYLNEPPIAYRGMLFVEPSDGHLHKRCEGHPC